MTTARASLVRHLATLAGVRWHALALPFMLALLASAIEGFAYLLLIPLTQAVGADSLAALAASPRFGWVPRLVPLDRIPAAQREAALILALVTLIILGRVAKLVLDYLRTRYVVARTERYRTAVTAATFSRVLSFGREYFDRHPAGAIDAEVEWSNAVVRLLTSLEEGVRYLVALLIKLGVLVAISLPLSLAFAITLPVVGWLLRTIDQRVGRIAERGLAAERLVRTRILDILGSIPLVKVNSQEREAARGFVAALREEERSIVGRERVTMLRYPLEEGVVLAVIIAVQGTVMLLTPGFSPGDLATFGAFLLVVQQALPDYKWVSAFRMRIAEERPRLQALARLFDDEGKGIVPSGPRRFDGVREGITLRALSFAYEGSAPVLREVSATIPAGAVTAIVGHTGAGKTTLADLLVRLYDCPPGTILVDGVDIREFDIPSLHARTALVSQEVWLMNRTLRDNLTFGLDGAVPDTVLLQALEDVALRDFFEGLRDGLDTELGDRGVRLSGGQRQRVALARALLRDPALLILDEATSALDSVVELEVAQAIRRRSAGRTVVVIAHRLSTIRDADQILVLSEGRLVEAGSWEALLARDGVFRQLHDAQVGGGGAAVTAPSAR